MKEICKNEKCPKVKLMASVDSELLPSRSIQAELTRTWQEPQRGSSALRAEIPYYAKCWEAELRLQGWGNSRKKDLFPNLGG